MNLAEHLKNDRFADYIGIERVLCDGAWTAQLKIDDRHLNGLDAVQGGVIFTLADYAFAIASNTDGRTSVGLQTSISYLAPAKTDDVLIAGIREISRRRTVSVYEIEIRNTGTGALIALFTGNAYTVKR